jgi:phage-related protein
VARENIDVTVELHDALSRPAGRAEEAIEDLRDETERLNRELRALDATQARAARSNAALGAAMGRSKRQWKEHNREQRESNGLMRIGSGALGALGAALGKTAKKGRGLGAVMAALKMPAMITAVTLAATAVSALGAAGVAAVAGLAPLVGVLGAIPALGAAMGQMAATMKLGFGGIGEALKVLSDPAATAEELNAALGKLGPEARDLAVTLAELKEQTDGWKKSVQAAMLPGFTAGLKSMGGLLPIVERGLVMTGGALGEIGRQAGAMVGTWGSDLNTVMERNVRIVKTLGPAFLAVLSIVKDLLVVGGPMAERFVTWIAKVADHLQRMTAAGRESGKLAAFFQRAGDLAAAVGRVIGDIAVGLFNVGREADSLSNMMGEGIAGAAKSFREWTESAAGQTAIRQFFTDAIPIVRELALLVRDVVKAFGGLATDPNLAPLIAQVRTELLPAVEKLAGGITGNLGSSLIDLATAFVTFSSSLSFSPFVEAVRILGDFALAASGLINTVPGLGNFIATLMTAKLLWGVGAFAADKSGLLALPGAIGSAKEKVDQFREGWTAASDAATTAAQAGKTAGNAARAAARQAKIMSAAMKAGMIGTSVSQMTQRFGPLNKAQRVAAAGFRMIGVAIRFMMGPWGLLILALVAVGVLIWQLYKRNEAFRNLVHRVGRAIVEFGKTAWEWIKKVGEAVGRWLVGAWKTVWPIIVATAQVVWSVMKAIWGAVKWVGGVIAAVFKVVWFIVKNLVQIWAGIWLWLFKNVLWPVAKWVFGLVVGYLRLLWTVWSAIFRFIWGLVKTVFGWIASLAGWLWGVIKTGLGYLLTAWNAIWGVIKSVALAVWKPIAAAAQWVWEKVSAGAGWVRDKVSDAWNGIKSGAKTAFDAVWGIVKPIVDRIGDIFAGLGRAIGGIWSGIKSGFGSAMDGVRGIINGIIGGINKLIDGINKVKVGEDLPNIPELGGTPTTSATDVNRDAAMARRNRFSGGPVTAGLGYTVAELGPELYVPRVGPMKVLGGDGAYATSFAASGWIVPNPGTPAALTEATPGWVSDRMQAELPYVGASSGRSSGGGAAVAEATPNLHVHMHGDGSALTIADVEAGALRAYRKYEREKRERR